MSVSGNHPFFRKEVLDARRQSWLGNISLAQPLRWQVMAGVAMALATAVLCMLFFGTYTARSRVPGELVSDMGSSSVSAPASSAVPRLQAQLLIPSHAISFIEPGDRILLRYQAFPYQKFGHQAGRVASISRNAITPTGGSRGTERLYPVLVDLEQQSIMANGKYRPLLPGMVLYADIPGERRRLYEWILKPLVP